MVIPIEALDLGHSILSRVDHPEEPQILRRDHVGRQHLLLHKPHPSPPVGAPRQVHQHDRMGIVLPGLQQGEDLEELVVGAEPAGEHHAGVGLPHEEQLAGEEVLEVDELGVVYDRRIGLLLKGEQDVHPEAVLPPGPFIRRPHDPPSRTCDNHVPPFGQEAGEAPGQIVQGIL